MKNLRIASYLWCVPLLAGVMSAAGALGRELWFDEALTVTNFMLPYSVAEIYFHYLIPNNQIVYTILLKCWNALDGGFFDPVAFWRLLSLGCALGAVAVLWKLRRKLDGGQRYPAVIALTAFTLSGAWTIYATALRGYAASWLWIAVALYGAWRIFHGAQSWRGWLLYGAGVLAAVGTVPTNLLAAGGVVAYALPWCRRKFWQDGRVYALAGLPLLLLVFFYAPIAGAFLSTFRLGEGFPSRAGALGITYGMIAATFGIWLGLAFAKVNAQDGRDWIRQTVWLLPAVAIFALHRAPFPRVFSPLLVILAMMIADGAAAVAAQWSVRRKLSWVGVWGAVQIGWLLLMPQVLSHTGLSAEQDDFFRPWYMEKNYSIRETVAELRKLPAKPPVYLSFSSDPCPLLFYAALSDTRRDFRADLPYGSVNQLPAGTLCVLARGEDAGTVEKRFAGRLTPVAETTGHRIMRFQK